MESKAFTARKDLIEQTLHGKPCLEALDATYSNNSLASEFDPITREITKRAMC